MSERVNKKIYSVVNKEFILIALVLIIAGVVHGHNMFGFPYYENDEGTYLSQAVSVISTGKLAPYTYWYDHAPVGWLFVSIWVRLIQNIFMFGFSLNSGRVFMLLIHLGSSLFVIKIAKKLTGNIWPGLIAVLIFSLSPLGIYFQRRLLLDNIMIFWTLAAYFMILGANRKLSHYAASAIFLGVAILSKENAVFFIPGFIFTIFVYAHGYNRKFALLSWLIILTSTVSLYFLYALLKGELFPYGSLFGGNSIHVSLIETLKYQASRGGGSVLNLKQSIFWKYFLLWVKQDSITIYAGIICNFLLVIILLLKRKFGYLGLCLLALSFWVFLMRGGTVIEFYITPLIPLMALLIGITIFEIIGTANRLKKVHINHFLMLIVSVLIICVYFSYNQVSRAFGQNNTGHSIFTSGQTKAQVDAVNWIRTNIPSKSVIVIDNYSYLDLHDSQNTSGIVFPNAHYYWKIDLDSEIRDGLLKDNPESIDYIAQTPQMQGDLLGNISPLTSAAIANSVLVKSFNSDGWGVDILATVYPSKLLDRSWDSYKRTFVKNGNQSIDLNQNNITTSEGQSYILMRSVWMDDKETFSRTWDWTKNNLTNTNGVFSWKFGDNGSSSGKVLDTGSATDADTDIALSLLFAYKRWGDQKYLTSARLLLNSIWKTEVRLFHNSYYILPGNWAMQNKAITINPSYISPYAYRVFAQADLTHPWNSLIDTSYNMLEGCIKYPLFEGDIPAGLPANWCEMDDKGKFSRASEPGLSSTDYSYDAIRTQWRLALDYKWYGEPRAIKLLDVSSAFLSNKWATDKEIMVGYTHEGKTEEKYESVLGYATSLANFTVTSPGIADEIYKKEVLAKFYEDYTNGVVSYWEDPKNYYVQNWAWFGTAVYANKLPNLWEKI